MNPEAAESPGPRCKIVRLAGRLNLGGPARQILVLCRDLPSERFESLLAFGEAEEGEREALAPFHEARLFLERIPHFGRSLRPLRDLRALLGILRLLRRERPRILHTHLAKAGALGRIAASLARVPIRVHTFHGHNFDGHFGRLGSRLSRTAERWLASRSTCLVAVAESVRADLIRYGVAAAEKIAVIPSGADLGPFLAVEGRSGALRGKLGIGAETPLIGYVGRLVPAKDPGEFLAMAAAVGIARPEFRFAMLGDGPLRGELLRQTESFGLRDRVFFAGWRTDLPECLADLDLLVSTSRSEGMPLALVEAMAAGVPVVARAVGGIPELLGDGEFGALVPPGSEEGLEKAVLSLFDEPVWRAEMTRRAREKVRERHGAARLARDHEALYRLLLEGGDLSQFRSAACR